MQPTINEWAQRHNITYSALQELQAVLASPTDIEHTSDASGSEGAAQQRIRLAAPKHGERLWRNNVGATPASESHNCPRCHFHFVVRKQPVRYGVMNDSAAMNKIIKSPDLIGITPLVINPHHVGSTLGIFTGIECKRSGWKYKGTKAEAAQLACLQLIMSMGGRAQFATGPEDIWS